MNKRYIRQKPYVNDYGIYIPEHEYVPEGCESTYNCLITRELFIEAYNKWIKNDNTSKYDCLFGHKDNIDDWWGDD